jgi:dTDP-4-dehydrorhamnose reductase
MKVFVTGGTGLVGSNIIKVARDRYGAEVIASIYRRQPESPIHYELEHLDVTDDFAVKAALKKHRPNLVIHAAASVDHEMLEENHAIGWRLMVDAVRSIAEGCGDIGAKMIMVSSDWVFDGIEIPFTEDTPPSPVCYYGLLKVVSETIVNTIGIDYGIARIAAVYGRNWAFPNWVPEERVTGFGTLPNWYVEALGKGEEIVEWTRYINIEANPTLASDCADAMMAIYNKKVQGIFHCCGRDYMNRVELARFVAKAFEFDTSQIRAARDDEMDPSLEKYPLPPRSCLDVKKTEQILERRNLGIEESLEVWKRERAEKVR